MSYECCVFVTTSSFFFALLCRVPVLRVAPHFLPFILLSVLRHLISSSRSSSLVLIFNVKTAVDLALVAVSFHRVVVPVLASSLSVSSVLFCSR